MRLTLPAARILDFDIENRPLSYLGSDFTTADVTAIAASFGPNDMYCWLLGRDSQEDMLTGFVELYNRADMVTGHYIRKHDLPHINGALAERGLPTLGVKMTSDTKLDLVKFTGISKSQESLAAMFGLPQPKVHMTQPAWRAANRLEHIELAEERVVADVRQHQALRLKLIEQGMLGPPKAWRPKR